MEADGKSTRRLQLELPPRSAERLERLKDLTEAASSAEVLRNALRIYDDLATRVDRGDELMLKTKEGDVVLFPLLIV